MKIDKIHNIDKVNELIATQQVSKVKKTETEKKVPILTEVNPVETSSENLSAKEYDAILKDRPLIKGQPLKNSFTKKGDRVFLAQTLNLPESELNNYINTVVENDYQATKEISKNKVDLVKKYIYRHGTKKQAFSALNNDLSKTKDIVKVLYMTLDDNFSGIGDYFGRPIHLLTNQNIKDLHGIIKYNLDEAEAKGFIDNDENAKTADWALKKIYQIQNNQKILNGAKISKKYSNKKVGQ